MRLIYDIAYSRINNRKKKCKKETKRTENNNFFLNFFQDILDIKYLIIYEVVYLLS